MKKITSLLLALVMITSLLITGAWADEGSGYVTVNEGTERYATIDAAVKAAEAINGTVTYDVYGSVTATGDSETISPNLAVQSATIVNVIGHDYASITLNGVYYQVFAATGADLNVFGITFNDERNPCSQTAPDPLEFTYIMMDSKNTVFDGCTFTEGVLIDAKDCTTKFTKCTFTLEPDYFNGNKEIDFSKNHYGIFMYNHANVSVENCIFKDFIYGAIKSAYNYGKGVSDANVEISVTGSTFKNCGTFGEHAVMHLYGADTITFEDNTITDCYFGASDLLINLKSKDDAGNTNKPITPKVSGNTVEITKDTTVEKTINIKYPVTIDVNGNKLSAAPDSGNAVQIDGEGLTVNFKDGSSEKTGKIDITAGDGTGLWLSNLNDNKTVNLENVAVSIHNTTGYGIYNYANNNTKINALGTASLTVKDCATNSNECGIDIDGGEINFSGNSTMNVSGCGKNLFGQIYASNTKIILSDNAEATIEHTTGTDNAVVLTSGSSLTIKDNAKMTVDYNCNPQNGDEGGRGINGGSATDTINVEGNGILIVKSTGKGLYGIRRPTVNVSDNGTLEILKYNTALNKSTTLNASDNSNVTFDCDALFESNNDVLTAKAGAKTLPKVLTHNDSLTQLGWKKSDGGNVFFGDTIENDTRLIEPIFGVSGTVTLDGAKIADQQFSFTMEEIVPEPSESASLVPESPEPVFTETVTNDEDGKFDFVPTATPEVCDYKVSQVNKSQQGITYDESEYTVKLKFGKNGIISSLSIVSGENEVQEITFKNSYKAPSGGSYTPSAPVEAEEDGPSTEVKTGDHEGYIKGYGDGTVHPEANITRAEVAELFYRQLSDTDIAKYADATNKFTDVAADAWYVKSVTVLSAMSVIIGRTDTTFDPSANVTRAEFAAMAARMYKLTYTGEDKFSDIADSWAKDLINAVADKGWIEGMDGENFAPGDMLSRAQAVTMLNRILGRLPETKADLVTEGMPTFSDNVEGAWYYIAIQEATVTHSYKLKDDGIHESWVEISK